MSIESQINYFANAGETMEIVSKAEAKLATRVDRAIEQSFMAIKSAEILSFEDRQGLWANIDDSLRGLNDATEGRLQNLAIIQDPDANGQGSKKVVVRQGDPKNPLFDPDTLASSIQGLPPTQALRLARTAFGKAFDLFQSNSSNLADFGKYRDRSRTMTAQVVGNGGSSSRGTYASTDNNSS